MDTYQIVPEIVADYNSNCGMNGNSINDIFVDDEERIWLANYPIGITIQNNRYTSYKWIKHSIGNKQSLINDRVEMPLLKTERRFMVCNEQWHQFFNSKTGQWRSVLSAFEESQGNKSHIFLTICEVAPRNYLGRRVLFRCLPDR